MLFARTNTIKNGTNTQEMYVKKQHKAKEKHTHTHKCTVVKLSLATSTFQNIHTNESKRKLKSFAYIPTYQCNQRSRILSSVFVVI